MQSTVPLKRLLKLPPALRRQFWSRAAPTPPKETGPELYDVVCVGGGPAGLSLVSALRRYIAYPRQISVANQVTQVHTLPPSTSRSL